MSPILPQFALSFGVGIAAASAIVSAFAAMRLLFAPVSGRLVQLLGERRIYMVGLLIVAVSTGASAFAQTYWQLIVLRSLGGVGSTMFTVSSMALVIRLSPPAERGRVTGLWSTCFLIGGLSGPLIGGVLAGFGLRAPFLIYATALLAAVAVVYFNLRDSRIAESESGADIRTVSFRQGLARPEYRAALWSNFANGAAVFGVRMALVPLLVVEVLGQPSGMAGVALTIFAAGNATVLFFSGRLSDRYGRRPLLISGALVCAVGTTGLGLAPNLTWLLVTSFVAGIGSGLFTPAQQAAVGDIIGSPRPRRYHARGFPDGPGPGHRPRAHRRRRDRPAAFLRRGPGRHRIAAGRRRTGLADRARTDGPPARRPGPRRASRAPCGRVESSGRRADHGYGNHRVPGRTHRRRGSENPVLSGSAPGLA